MVILTMQAAVRMNVQGFTDGRTSGMMCVALGIGKGYMWTCHDPQWLETTQSSVNRDTARTPCRLKSGQLAPLLSEI